MATPRIVQIACVIALSAHLNSLFAQCETSTYTAPSAPIGEQFGVSLSISGNYLAVGSSTGQGAAYVLFRSGGTWLEDDRILPNDHDIDMYFGVYLALSGDRLVVGAMGDDTNGAWSGSAYIFRRVVGGWVQEAKLLSPNPAINAYFGSGIALAGDVAVVGEHGGKAYVYRRNGTTWPLEATLSFPNAFSFASTAVATDGTSIMVASRGNTAGVTFFRRVGSSWVDEGTLPYWDIGDSLAISGNRAVAGVPHFHNDETSYYEGKVATFVRTGSTWSQQADLQPSQETRESFFGGSVSLEGNALLVGARMTKKLGDACTSWAGTAYRYRWNGSQWVEEERYVASDAAENDGFGTAVEIGPDYYVIGVPNKSGVSGRGTIYNYPAASNTDCNANKVTDDCDLLNEISRDCNGNSRPDECDIALGTSDDCTLDGVPDDCEPDCNNNAVADSCDIATGSGDCNQNRIPDECDLPFACVETNSCLISARTGPGASFGYSVAIDDDWAIGTSHYWVDGDGRDPSIPGSAYLFHRSGADWVFHADITPPNAQLRYAIDSAISGDRLAVVADNTYIRRRNGNNWTVEAVLPAGAIAMNGDALLLYNQVYRRSGTTWNLETTLMPNGLNIGAGDIDGDSVILLWETYDASPSITDSGTAFIFRKVGANWVQETQLFPPTPAKNGRFAHSVAIYGDYAVVGEPGPWFDECPPRVGVAHVFKRTGQTWSLMTTLESTDQEKLGFGHSVAIDGHQILVGRKTQYNTGDFPVATYELDAGETYWIPKTKISLPFSSGLGYDLALSGPWALLGTPWGPNVAYFHAIAGDCNENGIADACDIKNGSSIDFDGDQQPDSCACSFAHPSMETGPMAEPAFGCTSAFYAPKNRYLTLVPPATPAGAAGIALRVTMNVPGPYVCHGVPDFSASDGAQMWVGPEHMAGGMPTGVHRLQPTPHFFDWGSLDEMVLKVSDCNIVPCAAYVIDAISDVDYPGGPYSPALTLTTTPVWADIVTQGSATLPNGIVDFSDISVLVDRFKALQTAPPGTWCDLASASPTQGANLNIDFSDISAGVDAFRGLPYPYAGPSAPNACP